jgi:hypothetical protein
MHTLRLTMGLLIALVFANVAVAEETQQDDKSYLPPASLRAAPGTAPAQYAQRASAEPQRSAHAARSHYAPRTRRARRFAGPPLFFGMF